MAAQPSITDGNMVVAEIINEINSAQPQQPQQQQPQQFQQQPQQFQQQQPQRGTPINRPTQLRQSGGGGGGGGGNRGTPIQRPGKNMSAKEKRENFISRQKEQIQKKQTKVQFNDVVEEFGNDDEDDDSDDCEDSDNLTMKRPTSKSKLPHKFLASSDVEKNDLAETKGLYSSVMGFFTKDTKEPLVVIALVFAVSLPLVAKLMNRFLPFLMKNGDDSFIVLGFKALLVGIVFFAMKKLLL